MTHESGADTVRAILVNSASAVTGLAVGGGEGTLVAAAILPVMDRVGLVIEKFVARGAASVRRMFEEVERDTELSPQALYDRLLGLRGGEDLLVKALRAAIDAGEEEKIVALASALARASEEPMAVTFETQFVDTVAALSEGHFQVLNLFNLPQQELVPAQHLSAVIHVEAMNEPAQIIPMSQIRELLPALSDLAEPLIFGLQRYGLAIQWDYQGTSTVETWQITPFGRAVLNRLLELDQWREVLRDPRPHKK